MKKMASLLIAVSAVLVTGPARSENSFQAFRNALIDYFMPQGFLPVIVDRGYRIGDVVNTDGVNLYARGERCFPKLEVPSPVATSLPDSVYAYDIGMSFGLRLRQLFDSDAGAESKRQVELQFKDVRTVSVSLLDLRDALDRRACPQIIPLIDGTVESMESRESAFFVVSELLMGKVEARLQFATNADLELKTKQVAQKVARVNLRVGVDNKGSVVLKSDIAGPIAMKPVTVPKLVTVASFKNLRGTEEEEKREWLPVKCQEADGCARDFSTFADKVRAAVPLLAEQELDH